MRVNRRTYVWGALGALAGILGAARCSSDEIPAAAGANQTMPDASSTQDANGTNPGDTGTGPSADPVVQTASAMIAEGRKTFRYDTFGDEAFWGGTLRIHEALEGSAHGGVGAGVSPKAALAVGLKVDA